MGTVLIVDDEVEICEFLKSFFEMKGNHVFTVTSGEKALEVVEKESPQVMLLDLRLPGMSGVEVLRRVKEINPEIKVIIASGADDQPMEEAESLGISGALSKPFTLDKLESEARALAPELF